MISSETMVGYSEAAKCSQVAKVFDDAYRVWRPCSMQASPLNSASKHQLPAAALMSLVSYA